MYDEDDLSLLDAEAELESPLDKIEPLTHESEVPKPDPEEMLALLVSPQPQQRMLAHVLFVTLKMGEQSPI